MGLLSLTFLSLRCYPLSKGSLCITCNSLHEGCYYEQVAVGHGMGQAQISGQGLKGSMPFCLQPNG